MNSFFFFFAKKQTKKKQIKHDYIDIMRPAYSAALIFAR